MDLVATVWNATKCLCNCTAKHAAFFCHLEENLQILRDEWRDLRSLRQDVMIRVQQAERTAHMQRTNEVDNWLQSVNSMEQEIDDIQQRCDKIVHVRCLDKFYQKNCLSSYNMGKEVVKTLNCVKELIGRGQKIKNDDNIAYELPPELVDEMPIPKTVGLDLMLNKVWDSIEERNVGIIGLYGMGGAGKTTLMKKLNNEFAKKKHDFALVVWVVVSKERDIAKIMEEIRQKCGIVDINWESKSKDEKVKEIYKVMKQKKFILLLDDIWEELELQSLGVPLPDENNQSKILFTTRSENVCDQMQAKKFKVECLTEKEALDLFCIKVGEETLNSHRDIRGLAQELVRECKGLPLALITIGRAMTSRKNPRAWKHAIKELKGSPSDVSGMEKEVFFTLKFSYDSLPTAEEKQCFLYCALYPEDTNIYVPFLINLLIGEGFLEIHDSIHDAYNHGADIVESLKLACLLESVDEDLVKMHDVIRDMALWLNHDQDQNKNKVLVQDEALRSSQSYNLEKWKIVEKISMMYYNRADNWHVPICPHLTTLIVVGIECIKDFANIQFMSRLRVLRLVRNGGISKLPSEIGQLIHLEYFKLSEIQIKERFPMEMKHLKSLKVFIIGDVDFGLEIIPLEVISSLERLRVFSFTKTTKLKGRSSLQNMRSLLLVAIHSTHAVEKSFLEQLELLPVLEDLGITLETTTGINKLLSSTKFQRCVTFMGLLQYRRTATNIPLISSYMESMEHLEHITLVGFQDNMEMSSLNHICTFHKIRYVTIVDCHSITHLTWLKYAPRLTDLFIDSCNRLKEVIQEKEDIKSKENMDEIFSTLCFLTLSKLPKLKSIYKKALPFPMLQSIHIQECPNLKKLPLNSNSARNSLKVIHGEAQWWDNLEWENSSLKYLFLAKFKVYM